METIGLHDSGPAVYDIQSKLAKLGFLDEDQVTGNFDESTGSAVAAFCASRDLAPVESVDDKVWSLLLDASFELGDRTLYLRMPYFHGNDVASLQHALSSLGFDCGAIDGIFGAHTELALRKFQVNMGLPTDGIVGASTYATLKNLAFSWADKPGASHASAYVGFSRASEVLEANTLCLFGTDPFSRSVAARMSNLALATNPASKILSADSLLVAPDEMMLLVRITLDPEKGKGAPLVSYEEVDTLALRLGSAIRSTTTNPPRISVLLPGTSWETAGEGRSAQHFAITLLDALCVALLPE